MEAVHDSQKFAKKMIEALGGGGLTSRGGITNIIRLEVNAASLAAIFDHAACLDPENEYIETMFDRILHESGHWCGVCGVGKNNEVAGPSGDLCSSCLNDRGN